MQGFHESFAVQNVWVHRTILCFQYTYVFSCLSQISLKIPQYRFPTQIAGIAFPNNLNTRIPKNATLSLNSKKFPLYLQFSPIFWSENSQNGEYQGEPVISDFESRIVGNSKIRKRTSQNARFSSEFNLNILMESNSCLRNKWAEFKFSLRLVESVFLPFFFFSPFWQVS